MEGRVAMYLDIIVFVEEAKRLSWRKFARTLWKHTTIPNCLTVGAALAVIVDTVFIILGFINPYTFWTLVIAFCVDAADGPIAHRLGQTSREGAGLDRGADKVKFADIVILIGFFAAVLLADASKSERLQAIVMISLLTFLEFSLALMGTWGGLHGLPIESTEYGKTKMVFEYSFMTWIVIVIHGYQPYFQFLFDFPLNSHNSLRLALFLIFASNMLAIASLKGYWDIYEKSLKAYLADNLKYDIGRSFSRLNPVFRIFL